LNFPVQFGIPANDGVERTSTRGALFDVEMRANHVRRVDVTSPFDDYVQSPSGGSLCAVHLRPSIGYSISETFQHVHTCPAVAKEADGLLYDFPPACTERGHNIRTCGRTVARLEWAKIRALQAQSQLRKTLRYTVQDKGPFYHLGLDPALVKADDAIGYEAPMPIQREAIPAILGGAGRARQGP